MVTLWDLNQNVWHCQNFVVDYLWLQWHSIGCQWACHIICSNTTDFNSWPKKSLTMYEIFAWKIIACKPDFSIVCTALRLMLGNTVACYTHVCTIQETVHSKLSIYSTSIQLSFKSIFRCRDESEAQGWCLITPSRRSVSGSQICYQNLIHSGRTAKASPIYSLPVFQSE